MRRASLVSTAFLVSFALPLGAQVVAGRVVTGDSTPVAGAVLSLLDSTNASFTPTLSDEFGYYELRAPRRGTWRLHVERVGFARVTTLPFTLRTGETVTRQVHLRNVTTRLAALQVRDRARCDVRPEVGTVVATLWDEARKTLAAASASGGDGTLFDLDRDEIEYDASFTRPQSATRSTTTGRVAQVFRSAPPASLRALGYVRVLDSTTVYFGPDARALLSNEFAGTHCFGLAGDDPTSIRRIGITFTPVNRPSDVVDVAGTLWLDRESYELDRVEFRFTPSLSPEHSDTAFGGRVVFTRIPTGQVIVKRWTLRMPVYAAAERSRVAPDGATSRMLIRGADREVVTGLKVERGATRLPGEAPEPLPPVVDPRGRSVPSCAVDSLTAAGEGWFTGTVRDERGRAAAGTNVRMAWQRAEYGASRMAFRAEWVEAATNAQGRFALCGIPKARPITLTASSRNALRYRAQVSVPPDGALARAIELGPTIITLANAEGAVRGVVSDTSGKPIAGAQVMLFEPARRATTDASGQFTFGALGAGTYDFYTRRLGYAPVLGRIAVTPGDTVDAAYELEPAAQALATVTVEANMSSLNLGGFELRRAARAGSGQYVGREQIEQRRSAGIANVLRAHTRVRLEESSFSGDVRAYGRAGDVRPDGTADRCAMRIMVDGVLMPDEAAITALPPLSEIAGIEVYSSTGDIPPQFSFARPKCGLIAVWLHNGTTTP